MGQEIVYCAKCQVRVVGGDFEKGEAYRVGDQAYCHKCAMDLLTKAPVAVQQQILDQKQRALDRKTAPPSVSRGLTGSSTAIRTPKAVEKPKPPVAMIAGIAVVLGAVVLALGVSGGSPPPPPAPVKAPPPVVMTPPPQKDPAAEAKRELEEAERKKKEQKASEQTELLSRAREMGVNGEYQKAADLLAAARKNHPEPEWAKPLDDRIQELEKTMASEFPALRDKAVDARKRDGTAELGLIRDKVARWGSARYADELEKSLADVFPPVAPMKDGLLRLEVAHATLQGNNKFKRTTGDWKMIQAWYHPKDYLEWRAQPPQAGAYTIRMFYALPKEMNGTPCGGELEIAVSGGESKRIVVVPTAGWGDFKTITYTTINLPAAACTITVRPVKIQTVLPSLLYVEFVPVK